MPSLNEPSNNICPAQEDVSAILVISASRDPNSFSELLNTGRFETLCDHDVVFKPQKPYTDNSEILCYEDIDQFNDFVKDNCGCSTEDPLEPVNITKKDDSYFDDEDLFRVFASDKYAEDIKKYQEKPNNQRLRLIVEDIVKSGKIQKDDLTVVVVDSIK